MASGRTLAVHRAHLSQLVPVHSQAVAGSSVPANPFVIKTLWDKRLSFNPTRVGCPIESALPLVPAVASDRSESKDGHRRSCRWTLVLTCTTVLMQMADHWRWDHHWGLHREQLTARQAAQNAMIRLRSVCRLPQRRSRRRFGCICGKIDAPHSTPETRRARRFCAPLPFLASIRLFNTGGSLPRRSHRRALASCHPSLPA